METPHLAKMLILWVVLVRLARHVLTDTAQTITTITTTIAVEGTTEKSLSCQNFGGILFLNIRVNI